VLKSLETIKRKNPEAYANHMRGLGVSDDDIRKVQHMNLEDMSADFERFRAARSSSSGGESAVAAEVAGRIEGGAASVMEPFLCLDVFSLNLTLAYLLFYLVVVYMIPLSGTDNDTIRKAEKGVGRWVGRYDSTQV